MSNILIAEDEVGVSGFIEKGLRAHGYSSTTVPDGESAIRQASTGDYDLMVLDLGLPDVDGFDVLRRLRQSRNSIPIVVLTARDSVEDTVAGLDGGADDYMRKPFRFEELLARIRLRLRSVRAQVTTIVRHGDIALDLRTRKAYVAGRQVELTTREFLLAELLLRHPDEVLSREQLLSHVWGYDFDPGSNVVDVYVRYLRRKIGPERIETVRGIGYRLVSRPRK
ncbi:MAG TPA: response regulator transcription factor [Actinopolymorphaceae bacterium]|jgi:DNA-binding response OmpR family regulator